MLSTVAMLSATKVQIYIISLIYGNYIVFQSTGQPIQFETGNVFLTPFSQKDVSLQPDYEGVIGGKGREDCQQITGVARRLAFLASNETHRFHALTCDSMGLIIFSLMTSSKKSKVTKLY